MEVQRRARVIPWGTGWGALALCVALTNACGSGASVNGVEADGGAVVESGSPDSGLPEAGVGVICSPGTYVANADGATPELACAVCSTGSFTSEPNAPRCQAWTSCAPGLYVSAEGSVSSDRKCAACSPGSYCAGASASPAACAQGSYDHDGNPGTPCIEASHCAPGQRVVSEATTLSDRACAAGTLQIQPPSESAAAVCEPCAPGTYCAGGAAPALI